MAEVGLDKQVASRTDFMDLLLAGAVKYFGEKILTPYVGNGTLFSGAVKIGAVYMLGENLPKPVKLALAIDGVEDIIVSVLGGSVGASSAQPNEYIL